MWKIFHALGFAEFRVRSSRNCFMSLASRDGSRTDSRLSGNPKPFTNFLADRRAMDAADLNEAFACGISHEILLHQSRTDTGYPLPAGRDKAGFQNFRAFAGRSQTCRFDVWPDLSSRNSSCRPDLQAVALGEGRRFTGFNLRSQCG